MYTEAERKAAADIIKRIAHAHHVSETQVRADMEEAINAGRSNPDPAIQAQWATFHCTGTEHTLEKFIIWVAAMILEMPDERL